MKSGTYSAVTVAELAGLPYRTLAHWCEWGLLTFAQDGTGTGHRRRFDLGDLVRVLALARLRTGGASMQALKAALAILRDEYQEADPLGSGRLVALGGRVYWFADDAGVVDLLRRQQAIKDLVLVDMAELAQEARAKVEALAA